jgi:hypothetical protein
MSSPRCLSPSKQCSAPWVLKLRPAESLPWASRHLNINNQSKGAARRSEAFVNTSPGPLVGKDEVPGSNPGVGSIPEIESNRIHCLTSVYVAASCEKAANKRVLTG